MCIRDRENMLWDETELIDGVGIDEMSSVVNTEAKCPIKELTISKSKAVMLPELPYTGPTCTLFLVLLQEYAKKDLLSFWMFNAISPQNYDETYEVPPLQLYKLTSLPGDWYPCICRKLFFFFEHFLELHETSRQALYSLTDKHCFKWNIYILKIKEQLPKSLPTHWCIII